MRAYKCDRCGKLLEGTADGFLGEASLDVGSETVKIRVFAVVTKVDGEDLELCRPCQRIAVQLVLLDEQWAEGPPAAPTERTGC